MTDERDPIIAKALRDVDVPDYAPGFWDRLDERLAREAGADRATAAQAVPDDGIDPLELAPEVVPLAPIRRPASPQRKRVLAIAAAVAVALVVAWQVRPDGDEVRTASVPDTTAPTDLTKITPTSAASTLIAPTRSAEDEVLAWIDAVGAGDVDVALALTGPRTIAYYDALGADMSDVIVESAEGYGGWADSTDRTTAVVPLGEVGGQAVAAVVLSGTRGGDGGEGYRVDAFPVVQRPDGEGWVVEPAAFDPDSDGRLEVISPPQSEDGLGGISPDGEIELAANRQGTYFFQVDGGEVVQVGPGAGTVHCDPEGELTNGTHLLVIAQVDERNITAQAHTFTVEG